MTTRTHRGISAVAIVILIALVVIIGLVVMKSGVGVDGLMMHVDDYIGMLDNRPTGAPGGKAVSPAVVVDSEMKRIDELHDRLPGSLRAANHSDVNTVIVLVRTGTGIGAGVATGLGIVSSNEGSYSISAFMYDKSGNPIGSHTVTHKTAMSGAGAESEAKAKCDEEMLAWLQSQF